MRIPLFASFIVFVVWLSYEIKKSSRSFDQQEKSFWEKERQANLTRKKSLKDLVYITIPLDTLPMDVCAEEDSIKECLHIIHALSSQTIVNLTGYSNTELKLMYGAPNITALIEYDQNYTLLARTLQSWACLLYEKNLIEEALAVLEFAVSTRTDVSGTYKLLSRIYRSRGQTEQISQLLQTAQTLQSASKDTIVHILKQSGQSDD